MRLSAFSGPDFQKLFNQTVFFAAKTPSTEATLPLPEQDLFSKRASSDNVHSGKAYRELITHEPRTYQEQFTRKTRVTEFTGINGQTVRLRQYASAASKNKESMLLLRTSGSTGQYTGDPYTEMGINPPASVYTLDQSENAYPFYHAQNAYADAASALLYLAQSSGKKVHLVGSKDNAVLAVHLAAKYPKEVATLSLVDATLPDPNRLTGFQYFSHMKYWFYPEARHLFQDEKAYYHYAKPLLKTFQQIQVPTLLIHPNGQSDPHHFWHQSLMNHVPLPEADKYFATDAKDTNPLQMSHFQQLSAWVQQHPAATLTDVTTRPIIPTRQYAETIKTANNWVTPKMQWDTRVLEIPSADGPIRLRQYDAARDLRKGVILYLGNQAGDNNGAPYLEHQMQPPYSFFSLDTPESSGSLETDITRAGSALQYLHHLSGQKVHVLGFQNGSLTAAYLAAQMPDAVASLSLVDAHFNTPDALVQQAERARLLHHYQPENVTLFPGPDDTAQAKAGLPKLFQRLTLPVAFFENNLPPNTDTHTPGPNQWKADNLTADRLLLAQAPQSSSDNQLVLEPEAKPSEGISASQLQAVSQWMRKHQAGNAFAGANL